MIIMIAIVIIVILILVDKDEIQREKELENQIVGFNTMNGHPILRKHVNINGYDTRTGQPIFEYKKPIIGYNTLTGDPIFEGEKLPEPIKTKQPLTLEDKNRISNSILIITGAVLVVIASIIFLATGWETMHGVIKTIILFGIQLLFRFFGYISNEKLNIPKIGKMFNYLTLAFVPIVILSLSFFGLVGDFFSINGEGFYYFIGISLIISDIIFKVHGKIRKDIFTKQCSFILEIFAIIFIVKNIELMHIEVFALIIHTIITYLLLQGGYLDNNAYGELNKVFSIILIAIAGIPTLSSINVMSFTNLILLSLNFFIKCLNNKDKSSKKAQLIYFFISYFLAIRIIDKVQFSPYFLYLLCLLPVLGLIKVVKTKNMKENIIRIVGILTIAISLTSIFNPEQTVYYLLTYIISFVLAILIYVLSKQNFYKLWTYISFSSIFFCICYITDIEGIAEYILLIMPILVYAIEVIYEKLQDSLSTFFIISCLCIETLIFVSDYILLVPLVLMVIYLLLEKKKDLLLIPMFFSVMIFSLENRLIVKIILGLLAVIYILASLSKEKFNRYSIFSLITFICLCLEMEVTAYITWGAILVWGIVHYIFKPKENNEVYLSSIIFSLFGIYMLALTDLDSELYANYALGIIIVTICMTKGVLKNIDKTLSSIIEWILIIGLTLLGTIIIEEAIDGVVYLGIMLILSILAYTKEWKNYLYSGIVSIILGVFMLTIEYWKEIPWYVYILVIGLALILFAMYDEKRKQSKRQLQNNVVKQVNINTIQSEQILQNQDAAPQPVAVQGNENTVESLNIENERENQISNNSNEVIDNKQHEKQELKLQVVDNTSAEKIILPKKEKIINNNKIINSSNNSKKNKNRR